MHTLCIVHAIDVLWLGWESSYCNDPQVMLRVVLHNIAKKLTKIIHSRLLICRKIPSWCARTTSMVPYEVLSKISDLSLEKHNNVKSKMVWEQHHCPWWLNTFIFSITSGLKGLAGFLMQFKNLQTLFIRGKSWRSVNSHPRQGFLIPNCLQFFGKYCCLSLYSWVVSG